MAFYIFISFLLCVLLFFSVKTIKLGVLEFKFVTLSFTFIAVLSLLRFDVGYDYATYYTAISDRDIPVIERFEPLGRLLFYISVYFDSPLLVFLLFGIPTYYFILKGIERNSVDVRFSVLLYFCFFYLESLNLMRQALAVSICFWGVRFILKRQFKYFLTCVVIASLFHYSAIISLVLYPLYNKMKLTYLLWIIPLLFAGKKIFVTWLSSIGLYTSYLEDMDAMEGGALIRIFYILLYLSLFLFKHKKFSKKEEFFLSVIGIALAFPFLFGSHVGMRLSSYFYIYNIILIPDIVRNTKTKCLYAFVAFMFLFMTLFVSTKNADKSQYIPYQFFFEVEKPVFR